MPYKDPEKNRDAKHKFYLKHREEYVSRNRKDMIKRRAYIAEFKNKPCMDCNRSFPWYVMDLDHREGEKKVTNLAKMIARYAWKTILKEIAKCDVVCSNCHRERTHQRKIWEHSSEEERLIVNQQVGVS